MGTQHNPIISINGRVYNARTGRPYDDSRTRSVALSAPQPSTSTRAVRRQPAGTAADVSDVRQPASQNVHQKAGRSQTLNRNSVTKPEAPKRQNTMDGIVAGRTMAVTAPKSHNSTSSATALRQQRAANVRQSSHISKFGPVKASPAQHQKSGVVKSMQHMTPAPAPATHIAKSSATSHAPAARPTQTQSSASASKEAILSQGLARADSHKAKPHPKVSFTKRTRARLGLNSRVAAISAVGLALLMIGVFVAFQNSSNISMRIAAARAGVHASLPSYTPSGFSMKGGASSSPGQIKLTYVANADTSRSYNVNMKTSTWNSESLLSNYIANDHQYQRFEKDGRTIYIYDNSNATWVNGGVWYDVNGNSSLTSDQLINIAQSM